MANASHSPQKLASADSKHVLAARANLSLSSVVERLNYVLTHQTYESNAIPMKRLPHLLAKASLSVAAAICLGLLLCPAAQAARLTLSLDGSWQIADSFSAEAMPQVYGHTVPVPGLANLAKPAFPNVDAFCSRENLANRIRWKQAPAEWLTNYWTGKVDQDRNYFWYREDVRRPRRTRGRAAENQQSPVRHRRVAQRAEVGRIRRLFQRELFPS